MTITHIANQMKQEMENAIINMKVNGSNINKKTGKPFANGLEAKTSLIRSSTLINHLHEFVKDEFRKHSVKPDLIHPPLNQSKPELTVTGMYKKKKQDVVVKPTNINSVKTLIDWGPMVKSGAYCDYGKNLTEQIVSVNVRSQWSSLNKNSDTLFERTFAETLNLHDLHPNMVLGELYMIPVYEYDNNAMEHNKVVFKNNQTNLEKYINFFHFLSGRSDIDEEKHKYEKCTLVIIDFSQPTAKVYKNTDELKFDGLVDQNFHIELADINTDNFVSDLLDIHQYRFNNSSIYI